jgi:putative transposase
MSRTEHLVVGKFYHLFNRGINGCDLFKEHDNYKYFIHLYEKYIDPVADTYAWVLMKNHFHFLVKIKDASDLPGFNKMEGLGNKQVHQYFSNLFNAYTKAFNKKYKRTGSLFEKNFHRKSINNLEYLKNVIVYIHQNPVHHGFCDFPSDYPWSSYQTCVALKHTRLKRDAVIGWFDNPGNFTYYQNKKTETDKIEKWLEI